MKILVWVDFPVEYDCWLSIDTLFIYFKEHVISSAKRIGYFLFVMASWHGISIEENMVIFPLMA
jgi:hypothetical protein